MQQSTVKEGGAGNYEQRSESYQPISNKSTNQLEAIRESKEAVITQPPLALIILLPKTNVTAHKTQQSTNRKSSILIYLIGQCQQQDKIWSMRGDMVDHGFAPKTTIQLKNGEWNNCKIVSM